MVERRCVALRAEGDRGIAGVVARYGATADLRAFRESIAPGALAFDDVVLNLQHDRAKPLARTGAGLTLEDGPEALTMRATIAPTTIGKDALEAVKAGLFRGLSVEMEVRKDEWQDGPDGLTRTIRAADLLGIGVVDRPAYPSSTIEARAAEVKAARYRPVRRLWY